MMEPPLSRVKGLRFKLKLTDQDIYSMREKVRNEFDKIQIILKQLNRCMLLILRLVEYKIKIVNRRKKNSALVYFASNFNKMNQLYLFFNLN